MPNAFDAPPGAGHATNSVTVDGCGSGTMDGVAILQELVSVVNSAASVWQTVSVDEQRRRFDHWQRVRSQRRRSYSIAIRMGT
ncbi:MAG: hypothetical protein V9H26_16475 [Verrucomicrobiota bacterium]